MKLALYLPLLAAAVSPVSAANFSVVGGFSQDSDVQIIQFSVAAASYVSIATLSYAGGTAASGISIPEGGFDPYLALFDNSGELVTDNDDDPSAAESAVTGRALDASITRTLGAGSYTVAISEFDNSAIGPNLSSGFKQGQNGNFTGAFGCSKGVFCEFDKFDRTSQWALDFLNIGYISSSSVPVSEIPEPASLVPVVLALSGIAWSRCRSSETNSKRPA
jgi:hypothetical protein